MYRIAESSGSITDIKLIPLEFPTFLELSQYILSRCTKTRASQGLTKNSAGYFIRGGDLTLYPEYTTSGGYTHLSVYPRIDAALNSASLLVIDADSGASLQEISAALTTLKINHCGYTTSSHTKEHPKSRVIIPCQLSSQIELIPKMTTLKTTLSALAPSAAGGKEEFKWSNAWFYPIDHKDSQTVLYTEGKDFSPVIPDIQEVPSKPNEQPSKTFNEAQCYVDFASGKHITDPVNSLIMSWSYRYSETNIRKMLLNMFSLDLPAEHTKRYKTCYSQIDKFIKSAKKTAGDVTIPTFDEWDKPQVIPEKTDMYKEILFPVEYLPDSMLSAAKEIAKYNLMSVNDVIPSLIIAVCMSINKKAYIEAGSSSLLTYFHLAAFFIAESGRFKSTVYNLVLKGVNEGDKVQQEVFNLSQVRIKATIRQYDNAIKKGEKSIGSESKSIPSPKDVFDSLEPMSELYESRDALENRRVPSLFVDNVTEEGAIAKAYKAGGVTNFVAEEGQGIISSWSSKYSKGSASTDFALRGMSGSMYRYDRKGDSKSMSFRPVISCMIFVQPDIYESQFLSNSDINSSGMAARILPVPWRDTSFKHLKNKDNITLDKEEIREYWHITKSLSSYDDLSSSFHYETDDMSDQHLVRPVTRISVNQNDLQKHIDLFNHYRKLYAKGQENEGLLESLNKCGTMAYIMAGCLFAYQNYGTFFDKKDHVMPVTMVNATAAITDYLIKKKKQELVIKDYATRIVFARKVIKSICSLKSRPLAEEGMSTSAFHKCTNYTKPNADTDGIDAGLDLLIELGYFKVISDKLYLNPKTNLKDSLRG